ncbi:MAG: cytochrome C biogenesis protein, partial [Arenimonas sp.]|uniref:protein-disulfide reductase DsbD N-terminal domain-containing protein n=1 Tax=Arenimonas sp. TaxID=1872635 RepID=UPI0025C5A07F
MTRWLLALAAALLLSPAAQALDEADLLPIDEAFALTAKANDRGRLEFTWQIADGYYLYKHRMGAEPQAGFTAAGPLVLPTGTAYTDEFFGDVETYRGSVTATLDGSASADTTQVKVKYQGCADVGICYPPHTQLLTIALPAGAAAPAASVITFDAPRGGNLLGDAVAPGASAGLPLPEAQAFGFEAIVDTPDRLLLRFTPAPGYYLYRDNTTLALDAAGARAGAIAWPASKSHFDEHFGDVQVYFDQVDVPLPLLRSDPGAMPATLTITFQGCQEEGICYPPMTRTVALQLPAGGTVATDARETPPRRTATPLWLALLLALGGGVILNLMPCVLPVLSLKAVSLAQGGGQAKRQALWYTAGVLASFAAVGAVALALRPGRPGGGGGG